MTCTTTTLRLPLASSPVFSAAWMASFLVSATEAMAHNHGKTGRKIRQEEGSWVMTAHFGRIEGLVLVAFILGLASGAPIAATQDAADQLAPPEMALPSDTAPVGPTADEVIAQMLQRNLLRNQQL